MPKSAVKFEWYLMGEVRIQMSSMQEICVIQLVFGFG